VTRILFTFGTRPEAIKLSPLIRALRSRRDEFLVKVCVSAQHREMLDQILHPFAIAPDYDLDLMRPGQTLSALAARILTGLESVLAAEQPDLVVVQGDTTTTATAALSAFYHRIPVAHVEAGLRTGDLSQPFPEEMNRVLTSRLAAVHFAPTARAASALVREGVPTESVVVTGNTGIDAVHFVRDSLVAGSLAAPEWPWLDATRKLILVTSHRRENFGPAFRNTIRALAELARRPDVQIVYPVHRNPNVQGPAYELLAGTPNIVLLDPLPYVSFVDLMRRSYLIITDSGGIQEEAPSLGKPVLVLRDKTERPEAVEAGTVRLVGTSQSAILNSAAALLDDPEAYLAMTRIHNPYGDGRASEAIAEALLEWVERNPQRACPDASTLPSASFVPAAPAVV
jgi:UDP-N-acetylglucosamine 2-epimerase (non-hydrolysing)